MTLWAQDAVCGGDADKLAGFSFFSDGNKKAEASFSTLRSASALLPNFGLRETNALFPGLLTPPPQLSLTPKPWSPP